MSETTSNHQVLTVRKYQDTNYDDVELNWFRNSTSLSLFFNIYSLVIPESEIYFKNQAKKAMKYVQDEELKKRIQAFYRQESQHGYAHIKLNNHLVKQSPSNQKLLNLTKSTRDFFEKIPWLSFHLGVIASLEHFNAVMGELYLENNLLENSNEKVKSLFEWHFCEEIEHKAVSQDLFNSISGNYFTRMFSFVLTSLIMFPKFIIVYLIFLKKHKILFKWSSWKDFFNFMFFKEKVFLKFFPKFFLRYAKPWFNPNKRNDSVLIRKTLSKYKSKIEELTG